MATYVGAVDFYKACKEANVKPIIGCEFYVAPESRHEKKKEDGARTSFHLTLLAKNKQGYHNLCKLSSIGFLGRVLLSSPHRSRSFCNNISQGLDLPYRDASAAALLMKSCTELARVLVEHDSMVSASFWRRLLSRAAAPSNESEEDLQADGMYQESWLYPAISRLYCKSRKKSMQL